MTRTERSALGGECTTRETMRSAEALRALAEAGRAVEAALASEEWGLAEHHQQRFEDALRALDSAISSIRGALPPADVASIGGVLAAELERYRAMTAASAAARDEIAATLAGVGRSRRAAHAFLDIATA